MKIKKAVIAAAGFCTRFLPLSKAYPKELLPILSKPIIHLLIEELITAGIDKIFIVHQKGNDQTKKYFSRASFLEKYLKDNKKLGLLNRLNGLIENARITFVPQDESISYGSAAAILAAKKYIDSSFVYMYSDNVVLEKEPGHFLKSMIQLFEKENADAVVAAREISASELGRGGKLVLENEKIVRIDEKKSFSKDSSNLVQFGRFIFTPEIVRIIESQEINPSGELYLTDSISQLARGGKVFVKKESHKVLLNTGDVKHWLNANNAFYSFLGKKTFS